MHFELFLLISLDFILNVEYKGYFEDYIANLNSDRVFRLTQTKKKKKILTDLNGKCSSEE